MTSGSVALRVDVKGQLAKRLLAYASLEHDMTVCLGGIAHLRSMPPPAPTDTEQMVVWMGIVASYARAFTDGRRAEFAKPLVPKDPPFDVDHRWMMGHRHGYVAHLGSSEFWETGTVDMLVAPPGTTKNPVQSVEHDGQRWLMPDPPTLAFVESLVEEMRRRIHAKYGAAADELVDAAEMRGHMGLYKSAASGRAILLSKPASAPGTASSRRK